MSTFGALVGATVAGLTFRLSGQNYIATFALSTVPALAALLLTISVRPTATSLLSCCQELTQADDSSSGQPGIGWNRCKSSFHHPTRKGWRSQVLLILPGLFFECKHIAQPWGPQHDGAQSMMILLHTCTCISWTGCTVQTLVPGAGLWGEGCQEGGSREAAEAGSKADRDPWCERYTFCTVISAQRGAYQCSRP